MIFTFRIEPNDNFTIYEFEKVIDFSNSESFLYTFWNLRDCYNSWYDTRAIDLLYISMAVFAADRLYLRDDAVDAWSREYQLYIPVINKEIFEKNNDLLQEMLSFLTGDHWEIHFRERELTQLEISHRNRKVKSHETVKDYNQVCMFSGGLDSFIGAIDLLESYEEKSTLFVSHYGGGKGTKEYQDYLKIKFIDQYGVEERDFCQFYAKVVVGIEDTTRSRSFMFFSHAVVLASALGKPIDIIIPENGLISLNIPSTLSRIGTSSTRTTHPYYMELFQKLLSNLGLEITFKNPYQFKTKGEMLLECKGQDFMKKYYNHTMSCSHPDIGRMFSETEAKHCGYCLPCVIRQAAILKAGINDTTSYRDRLFTMGPNEKMIRNSYILGLKKFDPDKAFMTIQKNGRIDKDIEKFADLYVRGMCELEQYLRTIL